MAGTWLEIERNTEIREDIEKKEFRPLGLTSKKPKPIYNLTVMFSLEFFIFCTAVSINPSRCLKIPAGHNRLLSQQMS